MSNTPPNERYLGSPKFSYVPEGLIAHIAPSPGSLCSVCITLDYANHFTAKASSTAKLHYDDNHLLGTDEDISRKAINCDFCLLVIEALKNGTTVLDLEASLSSADGHAVSIYLDNAWSGSYYLRRDQASDEPSIDPPEHVDVSCMVVYTDTPLPNTVRSIDRDRGFIRLLANDAHLLNQQPMYHGRIIGNHVSRDLLQRWIKTCNVHHKTCGKIRNNWGMEHLAGPRSLRYIDTENMCICWRPAWELAYHVTLSYVWGGSQGLQLVKANQILLFAKGSLTEAWSNIPAVIRDAIELVRDLNTEDGKPRVFLWVDQLCIVQDDLSDKGIQIQQMNQTYSTSIATLIAAEGSHSDFPLTRHRCYSASPYPKRGEVPGSRQVVRNVQGLRLLAALPGPSETIAHSVWDTRAWTLQEAELSHASMIFGKDQVTFRCAQEVFCEDFVTEATIEGYKEMEATGQAWLNSQVEQRKSAPVRDSDWPLTFGMYGRIVESYTKRAMTYPTDILPAFQGVSQALHALCGWKALNGLTEDVIDYSLLWRPNGLIKRRFTSNGDPDQLIPEEGSAELCLPTYSWSAWLGSVTYQPQSYAIKSLIQLFEVAEPKRQKRRLVRFAQSGGKGMFETSTLEHGFPYAPQDCSNRQDFAKDLYWVKPQAQNLAYRWHMTKNPHKHNQDRPCILQFTTKCIRLVLSTATAIPDHATPDHQNEPQEQCRRVWFLDDNHRRVGTVWHVPDLDDHNNAAVDVILLSKNRAESEEDDSWQFENEVGTWDRWCLCNVMLIKRLAGKGLCERLTIGKIHERCADNGREEIISLV